MPRKSGREDPFLTNFRHSFSIELGFIPAGAGCSWLDTGTAAEDSSQEVFNLYNELQKKSPGREKAEAAKKVTNKLCSRSLLGHLHTGTITKILFLSVLRSGDKYLFQKQIIRCLEHISSIYPKEFKQAVLATVNDTVKSSTESSLLIHTLSLLTQHEALLTWPSEPEEAEGCSHQQVSLILYENSLRILMLLLNKVSKDPISSTERENIYNSLNQIMKCLIVILDNVDKYFGSTPLDALNIKLLQLVIDTLSTNPSLNMHMTCGQLCNRLLQLKGDAIGDIVHKTLCLPAPFHRLSRKGQLALIHGTLCYCEGRDIFEAEEGTRNSLRIVNASTHDDEEDGRLTEGEGSVHHSDNVENRDSEGRLLYTSCLANTMEYDDLFGSEKRKEYLKDTTVSMKDGKKNCRPTEREENKMNRNSVERIQTIHLATSVEYRDTEGKGRNEDLEDAGKVKEDDTTNFRSHVCGFRMLEYILDVIIASMQSSDTLTLGCRVLQQILEKLLTYIQEKDKIEEGDWQRICDHFDIQSSMSVRTIDLLCILWNGSFDSTKHTTKDILSLFIQIQKCLNDGAAVKYFTTLAHSLSSSLPRKQAFVGLIALAPHIQINSIIEANPTLLRSLFELLSDASHASESFTLLQTIISHHATQIDNERWNKVWFTAFFDHFSKDSLAFGSENLIETFIGACTDKTRPIEFLTSLEHLSDSQLTLLLISAKSLLKTTTRRHPDRLSANNPLWKSIIPFRFIKYSLESKNENLKLLGFNLVCTSSKTTELFDEFEFSAILDFIKNNITYQDPSFRQKCLKNIKNALDRIQKGLYYKVKNSLHTNEDEVKSMIDIHSKFVLSLFRFIYTHLNNSSNYPRRLLSLAILEKIIDIIQSEPLSYLKSEIYSNSLMASLLLYLTDSYESNKYTALNLLVRMVNDGLTPSFEVCTRLMRNVWELASSPKPPDSLSAAFILNYMVTLDTDKLFEDHNGVPKTHHNNKIIACHCILSKLEKEAAVASYSLHKAASSGPMYGLLLCLRVLLTNLNVADIKNHETEWTDIIRKVITTSACIANTVSEIVKNSSPEGHLPMDFTLNRKFLEEAVKCSIAVQGNEETIGFNNDFSTVELIKAQAVSAQMLLLCGWRCIKEISLLFGLIIQGPAYDPDMLLRLLSYEDVLSIGDFFLTQLTGTKHRGAFEQAYSGFGMVCKKLWACNNAEMNRLPEKWLTYTLTIIQNKEETRLCATRRSAGVPFIIQAILGCEPNTRAGTSLQSTMRILFELATSEAEEDTKIHAMNILRGLYRDSRTAAGITPYISEGIKISILGYRHRLWSIRNAASLLYAAVIVRALGVKNLTDSNAVGVHSAYIMFRKFPDLYDFFLLRLKDDSEELRRNGFSPSVFPTLLFMAHLAPLTTDGYSNSINLHPFIPHVLDFCASPSNQIRSLVSRAIVPLVTPSNIAHIVQRLCSLLSLQHQNCLHGALLCLHRILQTCKGIIFADEEIRGQIDRLLSSAIWVTSDSNPCYFSRAYAVGLFRFLVTSNLTPSLNIKYLTASCFSIILRYREDRKTEEPGLWLLVNKATEFFLTACKKFTNNDLEMGISLMGMPSSTVVSATLAYILEHNLYSYELTRSLITEIKSYDDSGGSSSILCGDITEIKSNNDSIRRSSIPCGDLSEIKSYNDSSSIPCRDITEIKSNNDSIRRSSSIPCGDLTEIKSNNDSIRRSSIPCGDLTEIKSYNDSSSIPYRDITEIKSYDDSNSRSSSIPCRDITVIKSYDDSISRNRSIPCRDEKLKALSQNLKNLREEEWNLCKEDLDAILIRTLRKMTLATAEIHSLPLIEISSVILLLKVQFEKRPEECHILSWTSSIARYIGSDYSTNLRHVSSLQALRMLSNLHHLSTAVAEKVELGLLAIALEVMVDDEQSLRDAAHEHALLFLLSKREKRAQFSGLEKTSSPLRVMEELLLYMARNGSDEYLTALLCYTFQEHLPEKFGLSQEEDRAFDKSETTLYRENIVIARMVAEAFAKVIEEKGRDFYSQKSVLTQNFTRNILTESFASFTTETPMEKYSFSDFMIGLKNEIESILKRFIPLRERLPFGLQHFDLWVERLARRAVIWSTFKNVIIEESIQLERELIEPLHSSQFQPILFRLIFQWLV